MTKRIVSDPMIMFGKPVIAGTRITVEHILRCLAADAMPDEIVADCWLFVSSCRHTASFVSI